MDTGSIIGFVIYCIVGGLFIGFGISSFFFKETCWILGKYKNV